MTVAAPESILICPYTFKNISTIHPDDLAVIYETNPFGETAETRQIKCGHLCTLSNLVSYLHTTSGMKLCPVCHSSSASFICDYTSSQRTKTYHTPERLDGSSIGNGGDGRVVTFRYGTTVYFLFVKSSPQSPSSSYSSLLIRDSKRENSLNRIANVLGMDVKKGMKVIYKGKIVYPQVGQNNSRTLSSKDNDDDVSEQLLDISAGDIIHSRKKPSLVVMGLRTQAPSSNMSMNKLPALIFSVAKCMTPWVFWRKMIIGLRWTFRIVSSLIGGISIFFRSILFPPQAYQQ